MKSYYLIIGIILILITGCYRPRGMDVLGGMVVVEATVLSTSLGDLNLDCIFPKVCPKDSVTLRIEKIDWRGDPHKSVNLSVGQEIEFNLRYSARPAKLRWDLPSGSRYIPPEMEDEYIIYHGMERPEYELKEQILAGLKENDRIKFHTGQYNVEKHSMSTYEALT